MKRRATKWAKSKRRREKSAPPPTPPPPPAPDASVSRLRSLIPPAALLLMAAVAYWPVYFAGFVWDDAVFVDSRAVATWSGLWDVWFTRGGVEYEGHYWPVIYTSFWLEHKLWGYNPAGFHIVNVLLHGAISVLLWRLLARLAVPGAWFAAAVFALHPIHVEGVAWIISRKSLLATLFYLLAAFYWLRYHERSQTGDYIKMLALFTAGMLSKSFVVTLPAAILIWAWWKRGRVTATDFARMMPVFLIGLVITLYDISLFSSRAHIEFEYSFVERIVIAGKALWFYPAKLLWPSPLPVVYSKWNISPGDLLNWLPLLAAVALVVVLWRARRRIGRGPLAAALFFAVTVSPMLGLAINSYMLFAFAADRYAYPASVGFIVLLTAAVIHACRRLPAALRAAQALAALLLVCYGVLTWKQTRIYHDEITFFTHVSSHNPAAHHAYYNLGVALRDEKRTEEAMKAFQKAAKQDPKAAKIHLDLGVAWLKTKDFREPEPEDFRQAERAFREAIRLEPDNTKALQNLAAALRRQKRFEESLATMETAAAKMESETPAWHYFYMGRDAAELERMEDTERYYRRALKTDPEFKSALRELVFLYVNAGRYGEALEVHPQLSQFLDRLAYEHFKAGRFEKALETYRHSVVVSPDSADVRANLGAVLAQLGRYDEALVALERALEMDPEQETALTNMKLVHEQLNRPK